MPSHDLHRMLREAFLYTAAGDERALGSFRLGVTDFEALKALSTQRGRSIGELREHLLVDKSRATRIVDGLEARGYVRRETNPADRRSPLLYLTAEGVLARERAQSAFQTSLEARMSKLSAEEQAQLASLLDKLIWSLLSDADTPS
jgi:DNA-binding MarR family transcriptional regulator